MRCLYPIDEKAIEKLKERDVVLKSYIERVGIVERFYEDDLFFSLIGHIISQLVSTKTANTIYQRVLNQVVELTPENLLETDEEVLRSCGISLKKVSNMKHLCQDIVAGNLDLEKLMVLDDQKIIETLTVYPGIGQWTVEMLLIFTLQRKDIISYGDLGIRSGIQKLYGIEKLTKKDFKDIKEKVSPYGSLASIYYWHAHSNL